MYTRRISNCSGGLKSESSSNSLGNITTTTLGNVGIGITSPSSLLHVNGLLTVPTFATTNLFTTNSTLINLSITKLGNSIGNIVNFTCQNTTIGSILSTNIISTNSTINNFISTSSNISILSATNISASSCTIPNLISNNITVGNIVGLGAIPTGALLMWSLESVPNGFLLCNGSSVSITSYQNLFNVIGYTFGGSGNNFILPDLKGRIPVGLGNSTSTNSLGRVGGSETHTLTIAEMPSHNHNSSGSTSFEGSHTHTYSIYSGGSGGDGGIGFSGAETESDFSRTTQSAGDHAHNFTTGNVGGNVAHENMQSFIVINYMIKT